MIGFWKRIKRLHSFKIKLIYNLYVQFHKDFVIVEDQKITCGIKSKPIKGEANKEIIKKLAKHFTVSSTKIKIRSGQKSREKIVEILS